MDRFEELPRDPRDSRQNPNYRCRKTGVIVTAKTVGCPKRFAEIEDRFTAKPDDLYVVSYPRTGTTWTQELIHLVATDLDFETAKNVRNTERFPYLEMPFTPLDQIIQLSSPRLIKTHYPYSLLHPSILENKCKMVYVTRNPRDMLVSYYYFLKQMGDDGFTGDLKTFLELFVEDLLVYSPFGTHVLDFWNRRNEENILFLLYEDIKKDTASAVKKIAAFLGKSLTDQQIDQIVDHCSFSKMKASPAMWLLQDDSFELLRKVRPDKNSNSERKTILEQAYEKINESSRMPVREIGDWKLHFTEEMVQKMDSYVDKYFGSSGLVFRYE